MLGLLSLTGKNVTMIVPPSVDAKAATFTTAAGGRDTKKHSFEFDSVFGQASTQPEVFEVQVSADQGECRVHGSPTAVYPCSLCRIWCKALWMGTKSASFRTAKRALGRPGRCRGGRAMRKASSQGPSTKSWRSPLTWLSKGGCTSSPRASWKFTRKTFEIC